MYSRVRARSTEGFDLMFVVCERFVCSFQPFVFHVECLKNVNVCDFRNLSALKIIDVEKEMLDGYFINAKLMYNTIYMKSIHLQLMHN